MWLMNLIKRRASGTDCYYQDFCSVCPSDKLETCSECKSYITIDSGYGWCKAMPEPVVVAQCRDTCDQFRYYTRRRMADEQD